MVDIIKLDMTDIWASGGDKIAPSTAKIAQGWLVEVVPRQTWNWFENRQDQNIAYLLQKGFPEWDTFTEYVASKSWVNYNGIIYKSILTGTNKIPTSQPTYWVKAFPESSASLEAIRTLTPAADRVAYYTSASAAALMTVTSFARTILDDTSNTAVRTTIGAQASHVNLTALSGAGVVGAVNLLPYFDSTTTMAGTTLSAYGRSLIDDVDAPAARTTLGLGTAAVALVTTSSTDTTAGSVTKVGDFGLGGDSVTVTDLNTISVNGWYKITSAGANIPAAGNWMVLHMSYSTSNTQIAVNTTTNTIYTRICPSGVWGAWAPQASLADAINAFNAYGLGDVAAPLITDLNTPAVTGWSRFSNTAANIPLAASSGIVETVVYAASTYRTQTAITVQQTDAAKYNRLFTRTMNSGTWGPWKEFVDGATLTSTLASYALKGANTDITSLSNISLNGTNGLTGVLSSNTADATTVPSSSGTLITPKVRLSDTAASAASVLALQGYQFTSGGFGSTLVGTRSYGAVGVHTAVPTDRSVFTLLGAASDGTKYNPIGRIDYYTAEAQTTTRAGGEIRFLTTPIGSLVPTLSMTVRSNGDVAVVGSVIANAMTLTNALPVASGGTGGTSAAAARIQLQAVGYDLTTGSATLPTGTTAQRTASPANGMIRYNTDTNEFEGYQNGSWAGIGGGNPLFTVLWWPSRTAIPAGYVPADGQLLNRSSYQAAWARIAVADVPFTNDATWVNTGAGIYRGYYTDGNGSTTFRVPDLNGKVAGSLGAMFLRGDGLLSSGVPGQMQISDIGKHSHYLSTNLNETSSTVTGSTGGTAFNNAMKLQYLGNDAAGNFPLYAANSGGAESRPVNVTGVWVIKLIGGATAASQEDASIAVAALDARAYQRQNILGAVGNSGGTPTGAIFETGTNASGRYTKFANGMVICELANFNVAVGANAVTLSDRSLPTSVLNTTTVFVAATGQPDMSNYHYGFNACFLVNPTTVRVVHYNGPSAQNIVQVQTIVIGRWY